MKRAPKIPTPKPMKRPASVPQNRHPRTGKFVKGIGTGQQIQPPLGPTFGP